MVGLVVALGVGGELEEHLLQPGAVGRPQLEDRYSGLEGCAADLVGVGLGKEAVGPDGRRRDPAGGEGSGQDVRFGRANDRTGGGEQVGLGALGDDPAVADHHEVVGDHLDLVEQV